VCLGREMMTENWGRGRGGDIQREVCELVDFADHGGPTCRRS
jgi:hypothetical protein